MLPADVWGLTIRCLGIALEGHIENTGSNESCKHDTNLFRVFAGKRNQDKRHDEDQERAEPVKEPLLCLHRLLSYLRMPVTLPARAIGAAATLGFRLPVDAVVTAGFVIATIPEGEGPRAILAGAGAAGETQQHQKNGEESHLLRV